MGLDMYLEARKYISGYQWEDAIKNETYQALQVVFGIDSQDDIPDGNPSGTAALNVRYWRKANAIHAWFVENCQAGNDDCGEYYVSNEKLADLRDTCLAALANRDEHRTVLPPASGFFFGSDELDDYYWEYVEHTAEVLTKLLEKPTYKDATFYYSSSW